jgi:amidase
MPDLISKSATDVVQLLRCGDVSPLDLLDALEARIAVVNPQVNALPTLCFDRARTNAQKLMSRDVRSRGLLAGLPVAIKDLIEVKGVRTTRGSPIFENHVPGNSDILVETLEDNGAIIYAKTNTPEFGAGANTFNEVFGYTRNPWNTSLSAAGSSGGSAVALATGMAWLAHGSDMGGSLRNPASFCGIVGLRPSPGRIAATPGFHIDETLSVEGPMARNVADLALFLDAMSGEHPGDPLSIPAPIVSFQQGLRTPDKPRRIAYSKDLGITPVDPEVARLTLKAARQFEHLGVEVEEAHPDLAEAHDCFQVLRARSFAVSLKVHYENHRDKLKPEVVWNIEQGLKLSSDDIIRAERQRHDMFKRAAAFYERYDLLLTPATIVSPYPVEQRYVESCDGRRFGNYVEWLAIAYAITLICSPALSLLCGFTAAGLPVGLQIAGPPHGEAAVLKAASMLESVLDLSKLIPIDPRGSVGLHPAAQGLP